MLDKYLFQQDLDTEEHIIATYYVESKDFLKAAKAIAIGQSIGNPDVRNDRETESLLKNHLAKIMDSKSNLSSVQQGFVKIAYPLVNLDMEEDGITQLFAMLMGGQMDIDSIISCRLEKIEFPKRYLKIFKGPKIGMDEIIKRTKAKGRPLLGGIVKPKTGITPNQLKAMCVELVEGGVDFIKEDEILGNPKICTFNDRIELVSNAVNDAADDQGKEVFYAPCINADYPYFIERARKAEEVGAKAVHINFWAGLPAYKVLRDQDFNLAIHFQKSGDKILTSVHHPYSIKWSVLTELARLMGSDFIHAGMWGGYLSDSKKDLTEVMTSLRQKSDFKKTVAALSCGSHPGLVNTTVKNFGTDLMMNVGGAIQGHPSGTIAGAKAMRQAMEATMRNIPVREHMKHKPELKAAVEKWGCTEEEQKE